MNAVATTGKRRGRVTKIERSLAVAGINNETRGLYAKEN